MNKDTTTIINALGPAGLKVLEISAYDICDRPLDDTFDLIIAEQVFEHLLWPYRSARNVHRMLRPGGSFLITTPFLVKIHPVPYDCSRWTETGMKHLLAAMCRGEPRKQVADLPTLAPFARERTGLPCRRLGHRAQMTSTRPE